MVGIHRYMDCDIVSTCMETCSSLYGVCVASTLEGKDGALLNMGSRFYDQRIGQSTTLTGRSINRHQASKINELLTGEYKEYGTSQIYCDVMPDVAVAAMNNMDRLMRGISRQSAS